MPWRSNCKRPDASAQKAERLSWIAAVGALLFSILLSALLARSIVLPLSRLGRRHAGGVGGTLRLSSRDVGN